MSDQRSIRGTVTTDSEDGKHQVAWKLADRIADSEPEQKTKDRNYWISLYCECWHAVTFGQKKP